jgi:hypothetical protein
MASATMTKEQTETVAGAMRLLPQSQPLLLGRIPKFVNYLHIGDYSDGND